MLKNIIITILSILVFLFWLSDDPDESISNDPNDVTIEYQCSELDTYESVPGEVIEECKSRGLSVKNSV